MKLPIVETDRLILRPVTYEDAEDLYDYCSDVEVTKYLTFPTYKSMEDAYTSLDKFFLSRGDNLEAYAIVLKENNKMIGTVDPLAFHNGISEIGYVINRNYWGNGYMTEAVIKTCEELFKLGIRRIEVCHHPDNMRSKRVIEKCGFVYEGLRRKYRKFGDRYFDLMFYSLFEEDVK